MKREESASTRNSTHARSWEDAGANEVKVSLAYLLDLDLVVDTGGRPGELLE